MVTSELLQYITAQVERGVSSSEIRSELLKNHWPDQIIDEAFTKLAILQGSSSQIQVKSVIPKISIRIIFGLVWLFDAYLKWKPSFQYVLVPMMKEAGYQQPPFLASFFKFWLNFATQNLSFLFYFVALTQTYVALAILFGFARKITYFFAFLMSVALWIIGEGFGGITNGLASIEIGVAFVYATLCLSLIFLEYYFPSNKLSLDYLIEKKVPWWVTIAEV